MRKIFILMAMTIAVFSSCVDNDDNPTPTTTGVEQEENPTEDALSVTTEKTYVMYGEFDEDFGNALGRRLKGTMTSPTNADIFVIDPSAVNLSGVMTIEELKTLIRRTESGEASLVLTKSTFREFYDWAQTYVMGYLLLELENFHGDYDSPEAAPARRKMANIMRNAYVAGQKQTAQTRATTVNGKELDWEHVNTWPAEKQNAVMFDGFAQSGDNELFLMDAEATLDADAEVQQPQNDYEWGNRADAMVDWLNRQGKENAQTRAGLKDFTRAVTRAASADINDLMKAQTKEFVFDYKYPGITNTSAWTAQSAITVQYKVYSAYDFHNNVEYYQVFQHITVNNDKTHWEVNGDNAWVRKNDGIYNRARGAWMKRIDTKMWLEGSGGKSIMSIIPNNENGTSSGSSSTGGSTTTTTGYSDGYSFGGSLTGSYSGSGPGGGLGFNGSYSHTKSYSQSDGITWSTTTTWSTQDITTTLHKGDIPSWTHAGNTPTTYQKVSSNQVPKLLKDTYDIIEEQVLWKIEKPSEKYTLKASFNVVSEMCKSKANDWNNNHVFVTQDNKHDICFDLNAPNRYKQDWTCYISNYGNCPDGMSQIEYSSYIDDFIEKSYGNNSANFCWATLFTSTEATADGSVNARAVFQTFKNSIRSLKYTLKNSKGLSGKFVFCLKTYMGDDEKPVDKVTLDLEEPYNVGETLTENVNGYDLTFKVTIKNEEVELSSIPKDFQGELVIPANILDNSLTVTSLGVNCAVGRKGITAVTIPSTVKTIQTGALAELNIQEIIIPEGVTNISSFAFNANKEQIKVYLPSTLKTIDNSAFLSLDKIAEVHVKATTPPTLGSYIFYPRYNDAVLYVPKGCKQDYANAKEWKYFKNIVEE